MNISKTVKRAISVMAVLVCMFSLVACGNMGEKTENREFPKFKGTDFEGNAVDETIFSENKVTVVNFWFNECSACVDEMKELDKLNQELKEKGGEVVGINVDAFSDKEKLENAKKLLKEQDATFRNILISEGEDAKEYISNIIAFPTTILIDAKGNIIGTPIQGNIDHEKNRKKIEDAVDEICRKEAE